MKHVLTHNETIDLAIQVSYELQRIFPAKQYIKLYGIPRGGIPALYLLTAITDLQIGIASTHLEADALIDDIVDSGATRDKWLKETVGKPFFALIDKTDPATPFRNQWIVFPWEQDVESSIATNVRRLIQFLDPEPERGGLVETPGRVISAWEHWTSGYDKDPADVLKAFKDGADKYDQLVIVKNVPFYSQCEHHLCPFFGVATIGYIPDDKIVGLSKLPRLLDIFARRLQVQERLTCQVADAMVEHLNPLGVGVVIKARHLCCESRGIAQQGHHTVTSALRGLVMSEKELRSEFLNLCNSTETI